MPSTPGFEPGPHWWEASALTTGPPLLPITGNLMLFHSFNFAVYLLLFPLLYSVVILSLAAVKRLGSKNSRGAVNARIRNLVKRKEDDYASLVSTVDM